MPAGNKWLGRKHFRDGGRQSLIRVKLGCCLAQPRFDINIASLPKGVGAVVAAGKLQSIAFPIPTGHSQILESSFLSHRLAHTGVDLLSPSDLRSPLRRRRAVRWF